MDKEGPVMMREFFSHHSQDIASITRVNRDGIIVYTFPFENTTGANISSQPHVRRSMTNHQVVISDVFTSVQGFRTVAFAMPVFRNGTYDGSLTVLVPFGELARKNLKPIRVIATGSAWTVNQDGTILYSPDSRLIDHSVFMVYNTSPTALSFISKAVQGVQGSSVYTLADAPGTQVTYQAVYYPAAIGDTHWSIIVVTPEDEILSTLHGFRNSLLVICGILVISLFFFAYYTMRAWGIVREEENRKIAEAALRESERNYRSILENMQDIFYRSDAGEKLSMINPTGVRLMGYSSSDEMLNRKISSFFADPSDDLRFRQAFDETGSIANFETRLKKADGTILTVLASCHTCTDSHGNPIGVEGFLKDITDRKRADEELSRKSGELTAAYEEITATAEELKQNYDTLSMSQKALDQARKKLNLLNSVTFTDIQNVIFSLSGYLELEKMEPADKQTKKFRLKQEKIIQSISSSLQFARNYQDLGIKSPLWLEVSQVFLIGISHLENLNLEHKIQTGKLEIYADRLLEQVFFTLAENVHQHGGTATKFSLTYRETTIGLTLIFEDNGRGITEAMKEKIFERRFEGKNGMGLFLAREILSITGITITETGVAGKGARFEMVVPKGAYRFSGSDTEVKIG
jgi:PAS domain S-box-containing protein